MQREEQIVLPSEIYEVLKQGKSFLASMPISEAKKLLGYINVLKSREKKLYEELDLLWINRIPKIEEVSPGQIKFFAEEPKPKRKYAGFIIEDSNDKT